MRVFLKNDVKGVGRKGEIKEVSDGFAFNNLIPKGLVEPVTAQNKKKIQTIQENIKNVQESNMRKSEELLNLLEGKSITFTNVKNDNGHLFAAIQAKDIVAKIAEDFGQIVDESSILIETPIKSLGEHIVKIKLSKESQILKIIVE